MPRTAFVTGATGVLGLHLTEQLAEAGWTVSALVRPSSDRRLPSLSGVSEVPGCTDDADSVKRAMPDRPDAVFHLAADVSFHSDCRDRQRRTNVDGTGNVVRAALERGARRFVHTSTVGVYGLREAPFDESAEKLGRSSWINYFRTKAEGEEIVLEAVHRGLNAVVLNPSNIVGRYDRHNWGRLFQLGRRGKLLGAPAGRVSFCGAEEVARAHIAAVDRGRVGYNYLLGGADATYIECFRTVAELIGSPKVPVRVPKAVFRMMGHVDQGVSRLTGRPPDLTPELAALFCGDQVIASRRAVDELGYRPVPVREMFEDCYRWLVEEGLLAETRKPVEAVL